MTSATLAILVLLVTGAIAGLVLHILAPPRLPPLNEEPANESIIAQKWAGGLDPPMPLDLPTHGGNDGG
jgi:hypothetical protein